MDQYPQQCKIYEFPRGFLWGASTSSHQVEGDNRWSDWWEHEQSGRLPHVSGEACRHYERFEQDFDMARSWGHNAHRFSIEWSRIEPSEGELECGCTGALPRSHRRVAGAGSRAGGDLAPFYQSRLVCAQGRMVAQGQREPLRAICRPRRPKSRLRK